MVGNDLSDGLRVAAQVTRGTFGLDVELEVGAGEVVGLLGPNGAGKTTLLRCIAGLTPLTTGAIALDGVPLDDVTAGVFVPAERRPLGVVFQSYRLFGHMSVLENVAFAARNVGVPRRVAHPAAQEWLTRLNIGDLGSRRPAQLSGGQAQRVALARALAAAPALLLLDEPLAALDARTRLETRGELRRHLADFTGPTLVVTHDPLEAMLMTDRLVVIEDGRVTQRGTAREVARRPATQYVARLMGLNLYSGRVRSGATVELDDGGALTGTVSSLAAGERALVAVRPAAVTVYLQQPTETSARNVWPGVVSGLELLADRARLAVDGRPSALVDMTADALADLDVRAGTPVWLAAKATEVDVYPNPMASSVNVLPS